MVALRRRIAELETQLSQLQGKLESMEVKNACSLQTVKVLTFEANPMAKIQANLSNEVFYLRQENERLRQRIKVSQFALSHVYLLLPSQFIHIDDMLGEVSLFHSNCFF
ncbi:hypothetical protein PHET_11891 [Paragonimus heterotremus]|uniref:Uncharacterized protein n=1 Tax=Paragonimus heterotremus TaxID=100268 RepID=A0A8J4SYK3_9TREM|nr:hypothetical protein PHET_11891 [Paragonimus heterotremus]